MNKLTVGQEVTVLHYGTPCNTHQTHVISKIGRLYIHTNTRFKMRIANPSNWAFNFKSK
jgi:hypothetical protein